MPISSRLQDSCDSWKIHTCSPAAQPLIHHSLFVIGPRPTHAVLYMLRVSVPSAYSEDMRPSTKCWEKSLRSKVFHRAELLDGTRPSVLALKSTRSPTCSPARSASLNSEPRPPNHGVATPWFPHTCSHFFMVFMVFMVKNPREIEKRLIFKKEKAYIEIES